MINRTQRSPLLGLLAAGHSSHIQQLQTRYGMVSDWIAA